MLDEKLDEGGGAGGKAGQKSAAGGAERHLAKARIELRLGLLKRRARRLGVAIGVGSDCRASQRRADQRLTEQRSRLIVGLLGAAGQRGQLSKLVRRLIEAGS